MYRYICSNAAELELAGVPAESVTVIGEDAIGYAMCEVRTIYISRYIKLI